MRVWHVHVSARLGPVNGVVQAVHQLAAAQRAAGLDVSVLHGTEADPMDGPVAGTAAGLRRQVVRSAGGAPPDVIHLHELFRPPHLALGGLLRTVPYVVSTHGATATQNLHRYAARKGAYAAVVERRLVHGARAVVALTDVERAEVHAWLTRPQVVRVVPNVADPAVLGAPPWTPPAAGAPALLVSLARWDVRHKGLDRLAALAREAPEVDVVVRGGPCGNEPRLLAGLQRDRPSNLALLGPVTGAAKVELLRAAAAFVLLSRWEGLSMALLEAMALGVPCLVSSEVAATLGRAAPVVVLDGDPARAADQVRELRADPARAGAIGRAGRRWVERHASPAAVAAAMDDVYLEARRGPCAMALR